VETDIVRKLSTQTQALAHATRISSTVLTGETAFRRPRAALLLSPRSPGAAHALRIPYPDSPIAEAFPLKQSPRQSRLTPLPLL